MTPHAYELLPFTRQAGWRRMRTRHGVELYHYPSDLARQLWYHVFAIGRADVPSGEMNTQICQDRYVLHWVRKGTVRLVVRNRNYEAAAGDAFLMDLGSEPCHGPKGGEAASTYWISFNGKDMPRYAAALQADRDPVFRGLRPERLRGLIASLYRLTRRPDYAYEARASAAIESLLAELYASRATHAAQVSLGAETHVYPEVVRRAVDWIIRCYDRPMTILQICEQVGSSRSHFSRLFHRETGFTPTQWLNRYRIEQARRLLVSSDKTIAEIARTVGIPDQNYFSRLFRRYTGTPPGPYRRGRMAKP